MSTWMDTALRAAEMAGLRKRSVWERMRAVDPRDYVPARTQYYNVTGSTWDATSIVTGVVVGLAAGIAIGMVYKDSMTPVLETARKRTREVVDNLQEQLPSRLNITRMEEEPATNP